MSETPGGYVPLLPMLLDAEGAHWLDVDHATEAAINAANPFTVEQVPVGPDRLIGVQSAAGAPESLLSFRAAKPCSYIPATHTYFISINSSIPYNEPSRPSPDCLTPPNGATSVEIRPVLTPTMPTSSASAVRQTRFRSRV